MSEKEPTGFEPKKLKPIDLLAPYDPKNPMDEVKVLLFLQAIATEDNVDGLKKLYSDWKGEEKHE